MAGLACCQWLFGKTFLAVFPGLTASFWLLTGAELVAFILGVLALVSGEFRVNHG